MNVENIISMHRSLEGTVAYVRCHCNETAIHVFPRPRRVSIDLNTIQDEAAVARHATAS